MIQADPIKIYIIAGEASGDILGARLMTAMRGMDGGRAIEFRGIGGDMMNAAGLRSQFPMNELSLMGLFEIIPHIPNLRARIAQTAADIKNYNPDVLVTIDSPGFCKRVAAQIGRGHFPMVHYVAPSVWAWRPGRAKTMARLFDHVLCLLPFEPPYFTAQGMGASFVGHSVVESDLANGDAAQFRLRHNITGDDPILCLLPGSRVGEIKRLLPLFLQIYGQLRREKPQLRAVIPTLPHLTPMIREMILDHPIIISDDAAEKKHVFAASRAALAASGTVSMELAFARVPCVVAYRVHPVTAMIARRMIKTTYISLANIVLNRPAVPELVQESATLENLTAATRAVLWDDSARQSQIAAGIDAIEKMRPSGGKTPSQIAAQVILDLCRNRQKA